LPTFSSQPFIAAGYATLLSSKALFRLRINELAQPPANRLGSEKRNPTRTRDYDRPRKDSVLLSDFIGFRQEDIRENIVSSAFFCGVNQIIPFI
jgi:hypothetical protein